MLYPRAKAFAVNPPRIFGARLCGKTAGMLAAFQGFTAPYGGKKTGVGPQMFTLSGIYSSQPRNSSTSAYRLSNLAFFHTYFVSTMEFLLEFALLKNKRNLSNFCGK